MGFLRTDYSEVGGFEVLPVGEYEVIVSEVKVKETSETKKPMLAVTLTIRDDIEQAGGKRKIFDNMVEQENMMWKFQQVAKACQLPAGEDYATLGDFAAAIQYKLVRVKLGQREYQGEKQNNVAWWAESKYNTGESSVGSIDFNSDDLPF